MTCSSEWRKQKEQKEHHQHQQRRHDANAWSTYKYDHSTKYNCIKVGQQGNDCDGAGFCEQLRDHAES